MNFDFQYLIDYFFILIPYIKESLFIGIISFIMALIIGFILAVIVFFEIPGLKLISNIYISFFRSTPFITQLFVIFFGIPTLIVSLQGISPSITLIISMGLNEAAFLAEIIRGAFSSIDKGQMEAALVVGMTPLQGMIRIIIPQAIRVSIPSFGNAFISLIKMSSIGFTIGVVEIMSKSKLLGSQSYRMMEAYIAALFVYWILVIIITRVQKMIEIKVNKAY